MDKCCQNCRNFRKGVDICESGEIFPMVDDLLDRVDEDADIDYNDCTNLVKIAIMDPQNFYCSAWR